jgi:2-polyprenyl-6-methoxyphenol hydroxylase-like FAD-dependent oxidoreductase
MRTETDVLVVGAGTTGLAAALQAHAHGATVRVVDRRPECFRRSRAMMLHARALECLRPLGVTGELLDRADTAPEARIHLAKRVVQIGLGHADLPDTAFPHLTLIRQADVEDVLFSALQARGIQVDWNVEFVGTGPESPGTELPDGGLLDAELRSLGQGSELHRCRFLAGCDGQSSTVRGLVGAAWRGAPYQVEAILADLELSGPLDPGLLHVAVSSSGLAFLFALGEGASWRLLATRRAKPLPTAAFGQLGPGIPAEEVRRIVGNSGLGATVEDVRWSAQIPLQHRLASTFRRGPIFLAGDAAHAHSPAGGQGMNNGILDALNLGWKLGFASLDGGSPQLLESYGQERRSAARMVLALTRVIFFGEASPHPAARLARGIFLPFAAPLLPLVLRGRRLPAAAIRLLAQPFVRYRQSGISRDGFPKPGRWPRAGDRLPDADALAAGKRTRLHELTAAPGIHILLERDAVGIDGAGVISSSAAHLVHIHRLDSHPGRAVVAVRPDGYVGFRCGGNDLPQLLDWLRLVGVARA